MKPVHRHLLSISLLALTSPSMALGETRFEVSFDQLTSRAVLSGIPGKTAAEPEAEIALTKGQAGRNGEAAIIAAEALEDFSSLAGSTDGSLVEPSRGIRYFCTEALNPEAGEIRLAFWPRYNGTYAAAEGTSGASRLYYLFDSGAPSVNGASERIGGIQLLIKHVQGESADTYMLNASLTLASGEVVKMARPVGATPEQWHTVALRWKDGEAKLEFNDKQVDRAALHGPLAEFQEFFTVGGSWYGTWPLQGLIDEVQITGGQ